MRASPSMKRASGAQLVAALLLRGSGGVWSKGMAGGCVCGRASHFLAGGGKRPGGGENKSRGAKLGRYGAGQIGNILMRQFAEKVVRGTQGIKGHDAHPGFFERRCRGGSRCDSGRAR